MSSAAKLGVFMLVILVVLGYFVLKIEDVQIGRGARTKKVTAIFDSVAGLDKKSTVRVAGVRVGKVEDVKLRPQDGKAEVTLDIDSDVQLHRNATARVANLGLLGEKYVELDPGTLSEPVIAEAQPVLRGTQPASIDDVTNQVSAIASDVKAITTSLRGVMAGPGGQQRLEEIVANVQAITAQVRELVSANRSNVDATMANARAITESLRVEIPRLTRSIEDVAGSIGGTVGENRQDLKVIVENLRKLSGDLQTTTQNLNAITGQMRSGEGTVGKLLYSDEAHKRLNTALASVDSGVTELKNTLGRVGRMQLDLGLNSEYYAGLKTTRDGIDNGNSRSGVYLRLTPNPDRNRFYNVEVADTPSGHRRDNVFQTTVTDPATGHSQTTITTETKFDRKFLVSAQAGWTLNPVAVRIGLFDSTGGAGVDYLYSDRLRVTGEAFDFSKRYDNQPHLRLYGEYVFRKQKPNTPTLFLRSGVDNPLNDTAFTFGGGIRWREDDLKYLLGSIPIGK